MNRTPTLLAVVTLIGVATALAATPAADPSADDGFQPLFNGKNLSGWKIFPEPNPGQIAEVLTEMDAPPGGEKVLTGYRGKTKQGDIVELWQVKDGLLVGSGPATHLFSEKDDYTDGHLRVEAKINDKGNSGMYFRTKFAPGFPPGYECQINATGGDPIKTGSLYPDSRTKLKEFRDKITVMNEAPHKPDEFFVMEAIYDGPRVQVFVNGKQTVDFTDPNATYTKGHIALQGHDPGTVVSFKRVEFKPLAR